MPRELQPVPPAALGSSVKVISHRIGTRIRNPVGYSFQRHDELGFVSVDDKERIASRNRSSFVMATRQSGCRSLSKSATDWVTVPGENCPGAELFGAYGESIPFRLTWGFMMKTRPLPCDPQSKHEAELSNWILGNLPRRTLEGYTSSKA